MVKTELNLREGKRLVVMEGEGRLWVKGSGEIKRVAVVMDIKKGAWNVGK